MTEPADLELRGRPAGRPSGGWTADPADGTGEPARPPRPAAVEPPAGPAPPAPSTSPSPFPPLPPRATPPGGPAPWSWGTATPPSTPAPAADAPVPPIADPAPAAAAPAPAPPPSVPAAFTPASRAAAPRGPAPTPSASGPTGAAAAGGGTVLQVQQVLVMSVLVLGWAVSLSRPGAELVLPALAVVLAAGALSPRLSLPRLLATSALPRRVRAGDPTAPGEEATSRVDLLLDAALLAVASLAVLAGALAAAWTLAWVVIVLTLLEFTFDVSAGGLLQSWRRAAARRPD